MSFALLRMIGFSTMMYAIAKKVAKPPRISRDSVLPRSVIRKWRSNTPRVLLCGDMRNLIPNRQSSAVGVFYEQKRSDRNRFSMNI